MTQPRISVFCMSGALGALVAIAAARAGAAERTIVIARSGCELAVRYVPAPGVDYQSGVDVNGRPVTPADPDRDHRLQLPGSIPVIISDDLRKRFGLPDDSPLFDANAFVGIVESRPRDRRLTFNGVELTDREASALAAMRRDAADHR
jgi:hypothetical protein